MYVAKRLTVVPYFSGGVFSCIAGAFNPVGMILVAISAAAASFGGTSGLLWMRKLLRRHSFAPITGPTPELSRNWVWIVVAAIVAALFIGVLGPGVFFGNRSGH